MAGRKHIIPGFRFGMGLTLFYLFLIVLIPLVSLVLKASGMGGDKFLAAVLDPRTLHSYSVSFGCALIAAGINGFFGLILAWVLVRYEFPGKKIMDGLIDLPFALPTAVAGIALTSLYSENGWIGKVFICHGNSICIFATGHYHCLDFYRNPLCHAEYSACIGGT